MIKSRFFSIDAERCERREGAVRIIACIEDRKVIEKVLCTWGSAVPPPVSLYRAGAPVKYTPSSRLSGGRGVVEAARKVDVSFKAEDFTPTNTIRCR